MSYKWSGDQTFGTANVGILNADTIKGASITSNMSIGANLNGGSISIGSTTGTTNISGGTAINIGTHTTQTGNIAIGTNNAVLSGTNQIFIGASNKTTIINSDITNIGTAGLSAAGRVNIATGTNVTGSQVTIGSTTLTNLFLRGNEVKINEAGGGTVFIGNSTTGSTDINSNITNIGTTGLTATGRVNIASGTNVTGSELYLGSTTLTRSYIRAGDVNINHLTGGNINMGNSTSGTTNIIGNVTLGADALTNPTAASTNITIGTANSAFRLYTPITIGYGSPGGTSQLGSMVNSNVGSIRFSTTGACWVPLSGVSSGRYIYNMVFYSYWLPSYTPCAVVVISSPNTITNGQTTFGNFYGDTSSLSTRIENPGYLPGTGWQVQGTGVVDISQPNVAIWGYSLTSYTASYYDINLKFYLTRIG
jgi:hypothetical protein